jgi:ABC-type Fe3+/spermidine/putrescine transport system ATPase subunit
MEAGLPLRVSGLTKSYGAVMAVRGVALDVPPGRLLTLLGPSGCGKTTVLQSIAGFVAPDAGDIQIDGQSILREPPERRETAMLFQHYALFPHMSVRDNVAFGLKMRRRPRAEIAERVESALRLVRVDSLAERFPPQLSGGQKQRVALARAIVTRPKVLLLDEPFGALDQNLREAMQVELRKLQQSVGITSLIVTHDQKEAIVLSDLIAVMNDGRIEQIGPPIEIYDRPRTRFVAAFTGVENLLPARIVTRAGGKVDVAVGNAIVAGIAAPPAAAVGDEMILAVRAEAIEIEAGAPAANLGTHQNFVGTVTFARVLGAFMRYEVALADGLAVTISSHRREGEGIAPGAAVTLRIGATHCALVAG